VEIRNAKFLVSASLGTIPDFGKPEIAVAGRSNVGKSTFINFLTNNGSLAKTSGTPGRTRLLNFFEINGGEFILCDMPGYGYAAASKKEKAGFGALCEAYLNSKNLKCVVVLLDIRRDPTLQDLLMLDYLNKLIIPFIIVLTKADKLSAMQVNKRKTEIAAAVKVGKDDLTPVSALKKTGRDAALKRMSDALR